MFKPAQGVISHSEYTVQTIVVGQQTYKNIETTQEHLKTIYIPFVLPLQQTLVISNTH